MSGSYGWYFNSGPAPEPPTPLDVAKTVAEAINERLDTIYQHQLTLRPLPDTVRDDD